MIVNEVITIRVASVRADFDEACKIANEKTLAAFGIDEFGYSTKDKIDFNRSTDSIHVKFSGYVHIATMIGHDYVYGFEAWIEREEE